MKLAACSLHLWNVSHTSAFVEQLQEQELSLKRPVIGQSLQSQARFSKTWKQSQEEARWRWLWNFCPNYKKITAYPNFEITTIFIFITFLKKILILLLDSYSVMMLNSFFRSEDNLMSLTHQGLRSPEPQSRNLRDLHSSRTRYYFLFECLSLTGSYFSFKPLLFD